MLWPPSLPSRPIAKRERNATEQHLACDSECLWRPSVFGPASQLIEKSELLRISFSRFVLWLVCGRSRSVFQRSDCLEISFRKHLKHLFLASFVDAWDILCVDNGQASRFLRARTTKIQYFETRSFEIRVLHQNLVHYRDEKRQALLGERVSPPEAKPWKIELPADAVDHGRFEGHHQAAANRVIALLYGLVEVWRNSGEVIADKRQDTQKIVAYACAPDPADAFDNLVIGHAEYKQIAYSAVEGIVVEPRWVQRQANKNASDKPRVIAPVAGEVLNRRDAKFCHQ